MSWPGTSPLHAACYDGDLAAVQRLVKSGSNINALDKSYTSLLAPLHIAASQGHIDIAAYLISQKAKVDIRSFYETTLDTQVNYDLTPLIYAILNDDLRMAKFLLDAGASPLAEYCNSYSDGSSAIFHSALSITKTQPMKEILERHRHPPDK